MERIEDKIEKIMTAMGRNKNAEDQKDQIQQSYAQAATETTTKHKELAIEKERTEARGVKATTCNLFVHGLEE